MQTKIIFFSGSVCLNSKVNSSKKILDWSWKDHIIHLKSVLPKSGFSYIPAKWGHLVCIETPPFFEGYVKFNYIPTGKLKVINNVVVCDAKNIVDVGGFTRTAAIARWNTLPKVVKEYGKVDHSQKVYFYNFSKDSRYLLRFEKDLAPKKGDSIKSGDPIVAKKVYKKAASNTSSRVVREDLRGFVTKLMKSGIKAPVFSVSDNNSFHTSGYIWSTFAIRSFLKSDKDPNAAVAILNFDAHMDAGSINDKLIASDRWGAMSLTEAKNGCYLSIGNSSRPPKIHDGKILYEGKSIAGKIYGKEFQTTIVVRKEGSIKSVSKRPAAVNISRLITNFTKPTKAASLGCKLVPKYPKCAKPGRDEQKLFKRPEVKPVNADFASLFDAFWVDLVKNVLKRPIKYVPVLYEA